MPHTLLTVIGISALQGMFGYLLLRKWSRRLHNLEQDLQQFSAAMCQMAEIQMKSYRKLTGNLGDMEERIMDLAVPSSDSNAPLEKRHQVLALASKGIPVDDIVKRLNVPRGEAELILNLRRMIDVGTPKVTKVAREVRQYAQA